MQDKKIPTWVLTYKTGNVKELDGAGKGYSSFGQDDLVANIADTLADWTLPGTYRITIERLSEPMTAEEKIEQIESLLSQETQEYWQNLPREDFVKQLRDILGQPTSDSDDSDHEEERPQSSKFKTKLVTMIQDLDDCYRRSDYKSAEKILNRVNQEQRTWTGKERETAREYLESLICSLVGDK